MLTGSTCARDSDNILELPTMIRASTPGLDPIDLTLQVYLLGVVDFDAALRFQRRLQFEVGDQRTAAALIICEHPPTISVGRLGSHAHLRNELGAARFPVRWVNRGGGCILHVPGQLAIYPILPLDRLGLDVARYVERLGQTCLALVSDFSLRTVPRADAAGVWVGERLIAALGVAVRDWVSSFGAYVNVQPQLDAFRTVQTVPAGREPMTSLERERRGPVRPALVRQQLIEHFQACFGFTQIALFTEHPALAGSVQRAGARRLLQARQFPARPPAVNDGTHSSLRVFAMQSLPLVEPPVQRAPPQSVRRLPDWLKRPLPIGNENFYTHSLLRELRLETVCENARCPNRPECYARRTATFMVLGNICTRPCGFCSVPRARRKRSKPMSPSGWPRPLTGSACGTSSSPR